MSGQELNQHGLILRGWQPGEQRRAAVHVADQIAAEHPHPLDESMPKLAGRLIGRDPAARGDLTDLLDALGLSSPAARRAA